MLERAHDTQHQMVSCPHRSEGIIEAEAKLRREFWIIDVRDTAEAKGSEVGDLRLPERTRGVLRPCRNG